jgi:Na+-transporting NADH:ubiquinone oxidoreductase subunit A
VVISNFARDLKKRLFLKNEMAQTKKIKRGYDLKLVGKATSSIESVQNPKTFALSPTDFANLTPKVVVKEGAEIKAGDAIFVDKDRPEIRFCSPVSGEVAEIRRGEKRKILEIIILADKETRYLDYGASNPASLNREEVIAKMLAGGVWPLMVERPFGVVPNPKHQPKNIFVTGINSAPLAADVNLTVEGEEANLQAGLDALAKLTDGKVYLSLDGDNKPATALTGAKNVDVVYFSGPHPKGNAGVQMHELAPLNKGEQAFTATLSDVIIIGRLFATGKLDMTRVVAAAGSEMSSPKHYKIVAGSNLEGVISEQVKSAKARVISGNVLTGKRIEKNGYLGFFSTEITALPEGDQPEFLGWILPGLEKFSLSRTFFSWLAPSRQYKLDTAMHGEERAFVMTGVLERVFPFDIYPVELIKAILIQDIEKMEQLGIYEVIEEDFALCEVIDPSKMPLQEIVREGLDFLRQEVG